MSWQVGTDAFICWQRVKEPMGQIDLDQNLNGPSRAALCSLHLSKSRGQLERHLMPNLMMCVDDLCRIIYFILKFLFTFMLFIIFIL